jgi:hypothetical protein
MDRSIWRDNTMLVDILVPFHRARRLPVAIDRPLPALLAGRLESSIEFYFLDEHFGQQYQAQCA